MIRIAVLLASMLAISACATAPREPATQTCPDGTMVPLGDPCPPPPPPPPATMSCPDGTIVQAGVACPLPPPPPPPPYRRSGERG